MTGNLPLCSVICCSMALIGPSQASVFDHAHPSVPEFLDPQYHKSANMP
jgi:hypothetical protein